MFPQLFCSVTVTRRHPRIREARFPNFRIWANSSNGDPSTSQKALCSAPESVETIMTEPKSKLLARNPERGTRTSKLGTWKPAARPPYPEVFWT